MIQITANMRIVLAVEPVDFRKGIDGLAALCRNTLRDDLFSGALFVFSTGEKQPSGSWCLMVRDTGCATKGSPPDGSSGTSPETADRKESLPRCSSSSCCGTSGWIAPKFSALYRKKN
jgi:hypothetical protein